MQCSASRRARVRRRTLGLLLLGVLLSPGRRALAGPNVSVGATIGGGERDLRSERPMGLFHLGARGEAIFLRRRDTDMGFGPYVDVATATFGTFEAGGGALWVLPILEEWPFVVSAGGLVRKNATGWEPAAEGTLFWGTRSHNFHSAYGLAAGVFVQGRYGFGETRQADLIAGLQVDFAILALPGILVAQLFRGGGKF